MSNSNGSDDNNSNTSSSTALATRSDADVEEDRRSLVLFLLGAVGYEHEADRVARVSRRILESEQIVEGISRYQFPRASKTRLMHAARIGHLQRLKFITALGARVNMIAIGEYGISKTTALHFASEYGHTECVRCLCDGGAEISGPDAHGWSPLHNACMKNHLDTARLLCERGAQIDLQDAYGRTPLYTASYFNMIDVAQYLLERGSNSLLQGLNATPYARACEVHGADSKMALLLKSYPH